MSDDLVELDPYGKGWQMTLGIQMNWQQSETIKWTAGTGYLFEVDHTIKRATFPVIRFRLATNGENF